MGFGTETDIRDYKGKIVISHDIPDDDCISLDNFFQIYNSYNKDLPLALNIKADGLQLKLKELLDKHKIRNYFIFDMSVPDALIYIKEKFNIFTRQSEYEEQSPCYVSAAGIWLDEFYEHWVNEKILLAHIKNKKAICIVSPELHGRDYLNEWEDYRKIEKKLGYYEIMICTDYPEKAKEYFYEKN
jgi:hypothetical protein